MSDICDVLRNQNEETIRPLRFILPILLPRQ